MTMNREEYLRHFDTQIYGTVEGWLGNRVSQMVSIFGGLLDDGNIRGNIVEFGVHHGLFLFLLSALRNDEEQCFAIDCFDNQSVNIDKSGCGSLITFQSHLENLLGFQRRFFRIIERDTLSFSTVEAIRLFGEPGVKFLSIDAGHTVQHAHNDLILAQEVIVSGGIVVLDDYMSGHWPGVTEGFYRYMSTANRRLKPLLNFQNKLFLTTISEHDSFLKRLRNEVETRYPEEVRIGRWKNVEMNGSSCLAFA